MRFYEFFDDRKRGGEDWDHMLFLLVAGGWPLIGSLPARLEWIGEEENVNLVDLVEEAQMLSDAYFQFADRQGIVLRRAMAGLAKSRQFYVGPRKIQGILYTIERDLDGIANHMTKGLKSSYEVKQLSKKLDRLKNHVIDMLGR